MTPFKHLIVSETAFQPRTDNYFQFLPVEQKSFVPNHFVLQFPIDFFQFLFNTLSSQRTLQYSDWLIWTSAFHQRSDGQFHSHPPSCWSIFSARSQIQSLEYGKDKRLEQEGFRKLAKADYNSSNTKAVSTIAENLCRRCERFIEEENREKYPSENIFSCDFH